MGCFHNSHMIYRYLLENMSMKSLDFLYSEHHQHHHHFIVSQLLNPFSHDNSCKLDTGQAAQGTIGCCIRETRPHLGDNRLFISCIAIIAAHPMHCTYHRFESRLALSPQADSDKGLAANLIASGSDSCRLNRERREGWFLTQPSSSRSYSRVYMCTALNSIILDLM